VRNRRTRLLVENGQIKYDFDYFRGFPSYQNNTACVQFRKTRNYQIRRAKVTNYILPARDRVGVTADCVLRLKIFQIRQFSKIFLSSYTCNGAFWFNRGFQNQIE